MVEYVTPQQGLRPVGPVQVSNAGAEALASGIDQVGRALVQNENHTADAFASRAIAQAKLDWTKRVAESRSSMPEDGAGYASGLAAQWDEYQRGVLASAPAGARNRMEGAFMDFGASILGRAHEDETAQRAVWATDQYTQGEQLTVNRLMTDPSQFEDGLTDQLEAIDSLPIPPAAKADLETKTKSAMAAAALGSRAEHDPAGVLADLNSGAWDKYLDPRTKEALLGQTTTAARRVRVRSRGEAAGAAALKGSADVESRYGAESRGLEQKYGLPPGFLTRLVYIESKGDPNAHNPSGADGLVQMIPSTAAQYGVNTRDASQSLEGAARLAADNARAFRLKVGREPSAGELYLAHQQGGGGAPALLRDPGARAGDVVGDAAVRQNGGDPNMSAGEFAAMWVDEFELGQTASLPDTRTQQERVEASLADLPADERDDARAYAMQTIGQNSQRAALDVAAAETKRQGVLADLDIGISRGTATVDDIRAAYEAGSLKPAEYADRIIKLESVSADTAAKAKLVADATARMAAGGTFDPGNADDEKSVNAIYDAAGASTMDDTARRNLGFTIASRTGVLPQAYSAQLNNGMARGDAASFEQAAALAQSYPLAFEKSPAKQRLADFQAFAATGMQAQEAVQAASRLDQLSDTQREAVERSVTSETKDRAVADTVSIFSGVISGAQASNSDAMQMDDEWRGAYRLNRLRGMDEAAATSAADATVKKSWGPSVAAGGRIIKNPPEMIFGQHVADYIPAQLAEDFGPVAGEGAAFSLLPDRITQAEVLARDPKRPVSYAVEWIDRNGVYDTSPKRWTPDLTGAKADIHSAAIREVRHVRAGDTRQFFTFRGLRPPSSIAERNNTRYSIEQWEAANPGKRYARGMEIPMLTAPEGY